MSWSLDELLDVLHDLRHRQGDSTSIEVKRASHLPESLGSTICAFANMPQGGAVILGVDEKSGFAITGVKNVAAVSAAAISQARNTVTPAPFIEATALRVDGRDVVVLEVEPLPLQERPAIYKGQSYLRQSDGDYIMNSADLAQLEILKLATSEDPQFDTKEIPNTSVAQLDPEILKKVTAEYRSNSPRLKRVRKDTDLLHIIGVSALNGEVTLAGLYALGYYPQGHAPQLRITAAVEIPRENGSIRTRNRQDFDGPLPDLLQDSVDWVTQNSPTYTYYRNDGHAVDAIVYPEAAVRELISNALVHRDLSPNSNGKWVEIRIKKDRLIITNPGGLKGISQQQLESEQLAKNATNPRLYELSKRVKTNDGANVIEGEGAGLTEVFRLCKEKGLPKPRLIDTGVQFTAILFNPQWYEQKKDTHEEHESHEHSHKHDRKGAINAQSERPHGAIKSRKHRGHGDENSDSELERQITEIIANQEHARVITKNGGLVASAIELGYGTVVGMEKTTGLSEGQIRFALKKLIEANLVHCHGGWGKKDTTYSLAEIQTQSDRRQE